MSTQVNQSQPISDKFKQIISELSDIKIKYMNLMFRLAQVKNPLFNEHICQLMKLLKNAINIEKNPILEELNVCFTSLMLTYIFDITELISQQLDMEKYTDRHQNLIRINAHIDHQIKNCDYYCLSELKQTLLNV
jgi:hypothetical protein